MKKILIIFGLIVLIALAPMCSTPGSSQQQTQTSTTTQQTSTTSGSETSSKEEVLTNEKNSLNANSYRYYALTLTKGSKVKFSYETLDKDNFDVYILTSTQHNYLVMNNISNTKKNNQYLRFYSGPKSEFEYTFPNDGLYYFIVHNTNNFQVQYYYSAILSSGEKLQKYQYIISEGTNVYFSKDGWRSYGTYLQKGEVVNIYYKVRQNDYRNLYARMYVLDSTGYKSFTLSPEDYSGKIYLNSTNERDRDYEQLKWTAPEKGYYYFVFRNVDSPEGLRLDYKIYKQY
ncbi:MAG: emp24/gp25L/p24 family/GOLD [Candidatus Methanofastidiosum methylothiophilum]|uniref:Emp24/gp25L/p24 family/GOLD n=1 Tax=Candidatus Methanofastidiosum methylothiophilum TaxID=1705564 RepID=A0A150IMZ1_9EURY|nr:MAG: emp24/gp25L/p24 family/GOLD [Candidatus Methanofastidiosum methylthiophilus]KYC48574.1 MAG: emp24/gp25L/p24 family/GOLD [Candidatus Methanofastidiosum methylthiophilus]KYC51256.1 MAG: emp24/gp25L/p24 family/GOLD [Candidatus Methanofastidiosum methylthiophilus]